MPGRARDDDHGVALENPAGGEEHLVDLHRHLVGVFGLADEEGLDTPGQGELAAGPLVGVNASIGMRGRTLDRRRVESPLSVNVMRNLTPSSSPMSAAAAVTAPPLELGGCRADGCAFVVLGVLDDAGHRAHRREGVLADAGLPREHQRVGTVEDGVRGIRGLGAGGAGVVDHRLEHLGGDDDGLARRRAISQARFCTRGTSSRGISTPRSPRPS